MNFPIIHTNFWDAVIAIPVIISVFISHRHHFITGLFMGWFYGYAAIGNYSALMVALRAYRNK